MSVHAYLASEGVEGVKSALLECGAEWTEATAGNENEDTLLW